MPFPSTHWSMIARACEPTGEERRAALDGVLRRYLPAMRAHLMLRKHVSADRVDDLMQGFIADKIVAQDLLSAADREKGRFRSFLLVALNRYLIDAGRRQRAQRRNPGEAMLDVDMQPDLASDAADPCTEYTLLWARGVLQEARRRMESRCRSTGRDDLWQVFHERILRPAEEGAPVPSHEQLAGELALDSAQQAANLLITARRMFARMLRSVVSEYVDDEQDIDREIDDLIRALCSPA